MTAIEVKKAASEHVDWPSILAGNDPRFIKIDDRLYFGEIDGKKVGAVLATLNPRFDRWALNVKEMNRVRSGKAEGRIDEALVIAVKVDGTIRTYHGQMSLEEADQKLNGTEPRDGRFGAFYSLPYGFFDAPF